LHRERKADLPKSGNVKQELSLLKGDFFGMERVMSTKTLCWLARLSLGFSLLIGLDRAQGADQNGEVIFRHHFRGQEALAREQGATRWREIWRLPETEALRAEVVNKLAVLPLKLWPERYAASGAEVATWVAPLLEDLMRTESASEITGPTNRAEGVMAVRLNDERAALWNTNLWRLIERGSNGAPRSVQVAGYSGWEAGLGEQGLVQVLRGKEWLVMAIGQRPLEAMSRTLRLIDRQGRPTTSEAWIGIEADLAALSHWLPVFRSAQWPRVALEARGDKEMLRSSGRITFREPIPLAFEPWLIPTNSIVDPITSFTVGQGIAPLLQHWLGEKALGFEKIPNQFCAWGLPTQQRQAVVALPTTEATNTIHRLATTLPKYLTRVLGKQPENFIYASNGPALVWRFMAPPALPSLVPWEEGSQQYVVASILPVGQATNPPPAELFAQLGNRRDLVYYDWEITQDRIIYASQFYQLLDLAQDREPYSPAAPPQKWLAAAHAMLGNSVTELRQVSPKELALDRKSHAGFTGIELVTLVQWFNSAGFPFTFELPPRNVEVSSAPPAPSNP
jgi:hypothetical protein